MTIKLGARRDAADQEARCECGQLIAKLQQDGIELKCKRCKRIVTISFASIEGWTVPSPSVGSPDKKASATAL
jgi:phage FluMu protein Com